jgi:hypothetical protein
MTPGCVRSGRHEREIAAMSKINYSSYFRIAAALLFSGVGFAQVDIQIRFGQQPGWDPRAREGRCEVHIWVDHHAEVRLRGDGIFVRTLEGAKSYDEGSRCSQPLPYNSIGDFQLRQIAGRNRAELLQQPNRMNNFTALVAINDDQGGGDHYAFEVNWRSEGGDRPNAPAPFFDDVRACQDAVRQRFLSRNGRGAYLDFEGQAERQNQNRNRELIRGSGAARNQNESRDITYSCDIDTRTSQVRSGTYQFSREGYRTNDRSRLK